MHHIVFIAFPDATRRNLRPELRVLDRVRVVLWKLWKRDAERGIILWLVACMAAEVHTYRRAPEMSTPNSQRLEYSYTTTTHRDKINWNYWGKKRGMKMDICIFFTFHRLRLRLRL